MKYRKENYIEVSIHYTNSMHDTGSEKKKKTNIQASCDMIHDDVPKYTKYGYNRLECYIGYDTKLGNIHARPQETWMVL